MLLEQKRLDLARFFDYAENRLDDLFKIPATPVNGLTYLYDGAAVEVRFNFFKVLSDFYKNTILSDLSEPDAARYNLVSQLAENWAVSGEFCLSQDASGVVRSIRPDFIHPVYSRYSRDDIERLLIIYPEIERQFERDGTNQPIAARSARVIDYDMATGLAYESERDYTYGRVADGPRGNLIDGLKLYFVQLEDSPYGAIETIVRDICVRLNILNVGLNTSSIPILETNDSALTYAVNIHLPDKELDAAQIAARSGISSGLGIIAHRNFETDPAARYVERSGIALNESIQVLTLLMSQLGIQTGLPEMVFASRVGQKQIQNESLLYQARAKSRAFKHSLIDTMRQVGQPVIFGSDNFTSETENIDNVLKLLNAGLIDETRARELLQI